MLRVQRLTPKDWPVLKATRLAALQEAPQAFTSRYEVEAAKPDAAWQQMAAANASDETSAGFLAYDGVNPVGLLAALWQDKAQGLVRLVSLWVAPSARRHGVASQLLEHALGWARAVGALACEAEATEENHSAEVLYWRQGFRRVSASRAGVSRWLRSVVAEAVAPAWPGEDEAVRLVESDPGWAAKFEDERRRLTPVLSPWLAGEVEHIGSTAVPGLLAKPIVDIAARVFSLEAACAAIPVLEGLGYLYAPYRARQHWFCKPSPSRREFHLTLLEGDAEWARRLAFRNLLRADAAVAHAYAEVKQGAARQYATDREAYTDAKSRFVDAVSQEALGLGYFQEAEEQP